MPEEVGVRVIGNSSVKVIEISSEKDVDVECVGLTEMLKVSVGDFDKLAVRDNDKLPLRLRSSLSDRVSERVSERDALNSEVGLFDEEAVSENVSVPVLVTLDRVCEREGLRVKVNRLLLRDERARRLRVSVGGWVLESERDMVEEGSSDRDRVGVAETSETVTEKDKVGETLMEWLYEEIVLARVGPVLVRERDFSLLGDLEREREGVRPETDMVPLVEESEKLVVLEADSCSVSEKVVVNEVVGDRDAVNPVGVSVSTVELSVSEGLSVSVMEKVSVIVSDGSVKDRERVFSSLKDFERVEVTSSDGESDNESVRESDIVEDSEKVIFVNDRLAVRIVSLTLNVSSTVDVAVRVRDRLRDLSSEGERDKVSLL